ncbi:MAG: hypothetical protein ACRDTT_11055, partial [Pseudonocardiaceae bacterium]
MIPIPHKLITMFRRDRPVHQVPQALRDLDRAMQLAINEQQEAATLAKARKTLLANPRQSSATGPVSASRPRTSVARKRSTSPRLALFARAAAAAAVLTGIIALIVWTPPWVYGIGLSLTALTALVPIVLNILMIRRFRSMERRRNDHEGSWVRLAIWAVTTSRRTNRSDHQ